MSWQILPAEPKHLVHMHELIGELATFEKAPHEFALSLDQFTADFNARKFGAFVAEADGVVFGMSLFYNRYSTWKGTTLHLEDLIVRESERGRGIGEALFRATLAEAAKQEVGRMEWEVLDWNVPAHRFYEKFGARLDPAWMLAKLTREQLNALQ